MLIVKLLRKKLITSAVLATTLVSFQASAFMTGIIFDPKRLVENIAIQMTELEERLMSEIESSALRQLKSELKKSVSGDDSARGAAAQVAAQRQQENIRNHEVAHQNMPMSGLCDNAFYLAEDGTLKQNRRRKDSVLVFSMRREIIQSQLCESIMTDQAKQREDALPSFSPIDDEQRLAELDKRIDRVIDNLEDNDMSVEDVMPHTMVGLSQDEYENAIAKASIMFAPIENNKTFSFDRPDSFLRATGKSMRSLLPLQTQEEQISQKLRLSGGLVSDRESQILFAEDFFNAENIETYAYRDMLLPSQVERERAIMTAFLVNMAVQRYKSSLNKEIMLAARLVENIPD